VELIYIILEDPDIEPYLSTLWIFADILINPFTFKVLIALILMLVLLLCSALISGSEIAFFSLSPSQMEKINSRKDKISHLIIKLLGMPKRLLATILIANNFVNVAIIILSTYIISRTLDFSGIPILGFIIQVVVITAIILLIGEIIPKIYANQNSLRFSNLMARPLQILMNIFYPLASLLINSTSFIDKRINRKGHDISMSELSDAIEITSDENTPEEETKMLKGIVRFGDIEVSEIMKSRVDVTAVDVDLGFKELINIIRESGFSRIPAFETNFDNVKGILYIKDLLAHLHKSDDFNWRFLLREAFFVPENKRINDLLHEFQEKKIHLAIVVDEYGGTSGIVTLEDIIEEIVGDISDEFDKDSNEIIFTKLDDNTYVFDGKTSLNDFYKILEIEDDIFEEVRGESDTLAGLILELEGSIPERGDLTTFQNFSFKIKAVDNRRIKQIEVSISDNNEA